MVPLSTRNTEQRGSLSVFNQISTIMMSGIIVALVFPMVVMPMLGVDKAKWIVVMGALSVIALPLTLMEYYFTKERVTLEDIDKPQEESLPYKNLLKAIFTDKYMILILLYFLIYTIGTQFKNLGLVYFCNYVLGTYNDGKTQTLISVIGGIPMGIGIFAVWPLAKKFGKRNLTLAGFALYSIGSAICWICPTNMVVVLIGQFIKNIGGSSALWYFYDADGNPSGIRYKNGDSINDYYFVCNWRGDVIQIYNASGTLVGSYTYDAWGKVTENATSADTENITETNPIRYRGYYYDTETRLYYLKSRYYDPAVKRFLNVDGLVSTSIEDAAKNMFAYCTNNPVFYADSEGNCKYEANSYDFYRMNHGLPAAGCTCNTKKEPVKPDNNTGDSTAVVYTEKVIVPALKEILTSHANEILNGLILPQAALSPLLASKFETFLAGVSGIGLASILVVFHKIAWDGDRYENEIISLEDYRLSICITIGFTAFSAAAGAIIATAGMAVVPTIIVGVIAGVAIGAGEDYVRKKYGLPTTWY